MKSRIILPVLIAALAVVVATFSPLSAQSSLGYQGVTLGGAFGGHSGVADLNQSGTTVDWRLGWAASADATLWLHRFGGLRASGSWAQDSLRGAASLSGRGKFNKFYYDGAVVLRYPIQASSGTFTPYVLGGAGAVSLHQLGSDETWTRFAGNFGAGLEYRVGQVGFRAEGRDFVYKFDEYGFDKTQHDIAWQGGLTLSL